MNSTQPHITAVYFEHKLVIAETYMYQHVPGHSQLVPQDRTFTGAINEEPFQYMGEQDGEPVGQDGHKVELVGDPIFPCVLSTGFTHFVSSSIS